MAKTQNSTVAYCGLYCGACGSFKKGKCPGCHENQKASWCQIRSCCKKEKILSCAECKSVSDPNDCRKFNNFVSKIFAVLFRSDRRACIMQIREMGIDAHAEIMESKGLQSLKK